MPSHPSTTTPGIYHRVARGETLWRISQAYNVDLDEIARINRISNAADIETGQMLLIPGSRKRPYPPAKGHLDPDDFAWPLKGKVITAFGQTFNNMINKGLNIQPHGAQDVTAARSGRVVFYSDDFKGYGKTIIIDHGDGFLTVYAMASQAFVRPGEKVQKGTVLAKISPADRDKGYLHFEIRKGHIPQNPYFYLSR